MAPEPGEQRKNDPRFDYKLQVNAGGGEYRKGDAYSSEFRQRVVQAYVQKQIEANEDRPYGAFSAVARQFQIDAKSVLNYVEAWEHEKRLTPLQRGTKNPGKVTPAHLAYMKGLVEKNPTLRLGEIQEFMLQDLEGLTENPFLSESVIWDTLSKRLGYSHKKVREIAAQQLTAEGLTLRAQFYEAVDGIPMDRLLFQDEFGYSKSHGNRSYGYGPACKSQAGDSRAKSVVLKEYAKNISALALLSSQGFQHVHVVEGAADQDDFREFLRGAERLFESGQYDALVLDNCRIHHAVDVELEVVLEHYNMRLIYLPPYSPDLNPIEEAFSKVKHMLKYMTDELAQDPILAIYAALQQVTPADCLGYFRHYNL